MVQLGCETQKTTRVQTPTQKHNNRRDSWHNDDFWKSFRGLLFESVFCLVLFWSCVFPKFICVGVSDLVFVLQWTCFWSHCFCQSVSTSKGTETATLLFVPMTQVAGADRDRADSSQTDVAEILKLLCFPQVISATDQSTCVILRERLPQEVKDPQLGRRLLINQCVIHPGKTIGGGRVSIEAGRGF